MSSAILYGAIVVIWAGVLIPRWLRREPPADVSFEGSDPVSDSYSAGVEPASAMPSPAVRRPVRSHDTEHTRVLRARRRLLGMLVALAATAMILAEMRLAAWWVMLPPAIMLLGFLALLREASRADAERRSAPRARTPRVHPETKAAPGSPALPVVPSVPDADVIDITDRVGEEFYDQYADAKLRAVGD